MSQYVSPQPVTGSSIAIGALVLAALLAILLHFADVDRFVVLARQARPMWLAAALGLQLLTYACLAQGWHEVLADAGHDVRVGRLVPVAVTKLFADQAMPSAGIGGHLVTISRMRALGVPRDAAMAAVLLTVVGYYLSYAAFALATLVVLWFHREASRWLAGVVTVFLAVAIAIPSLALWLRRRGSSVLPAWLDGIGPIRRVLDFISAAPAGLVRRPRLIAQVTLFNGLIFLLDAGTLSVCLLSIGVGAHPAGAFCALVMASIATTLTPVPMGLGTFEATGVAMLRLTGVPFEAAVTAILLLRGLTLWLPLLPGLILLRRTRKEESDGQG